MQELVPPKPDGPSQRKASPSDLYRDMLTECRCEGPKVDPILKDPPNGPILCGRCERPIKH